MGFQRDFVFLISEAYLWLIQKGKDEVKMKKTIISKE